MKEEVKVIGLNLELAPVVDALGAVHVLLLGDVDASDLTQRRGAAAILALVTTCLTLVRAVVRGEVDPALVWAEHCASVHEEEAREEDDGEVRLVAWSGGETMKRLEQQLRRARKRVQHS